MKTNFSIKKQFYRLGRFVNYVLYLGLCGWQIYIYIVVQLFLLSTLLTNDIIPALPLIEPILITIISICIPIGLLYFQFMLDKDGVSLKIVELEVAALKILNFFTSLVFLITVVFTLFYPNQVRASHIIFIQIGIFTLFAAFVHELARKYLVDTEKKSSEKPRPITISQVPYDDVFIV